MFLFGCYEIVKAAHSEPDEVVHPRKVCPKPEVRAAMVTVTHDPAPARNWEFSFFSYFSLIFQWGIPILPVLPHGLLEAPRNHTSFIQGAEDNDVLKVFEPNKHVWIEVDSKIISLDVLLRRGYEISPKEVDKVIASLTENKKK